MRDRIRALFQRDNQYPCKPPSTTARWYSPPEAPRLFIGIGGNELVSGSNRYRQHPHNHTTVAREQILVMGRLARFGRDASDAGTDKTDLRR